MTEPDLTPRRKGSASAEAQHDGPRCLFCGQPEQLVWVHGHGQCAFCGVNAMPCCDGASCEPSPPR
ncbi:hypothetical protein AB8880_10000 [Alphaproteobacteria bacterium LSUCC0684]